jgi:hypothetical protein
MAVLMLPARHMNANTLHFSQPQKTFESIACSARNLILINRQDLVLGYSTVLYFSEKIN